MDVFDTGNIRNVVVAGHGSVGKTTLTEAALFVTGRTTRMGRVEEQNTVSDYDEDEHNRKFSINLSVVPVERDGRKINLIDTPGYADFVSEVICACEAADMALVVVDAQSGPEVGTDRVWNIIERLNLPRMIFINRMDRESADFEGTLLTMQERWGPTVVPLQLPIGSADTFNGVVDLLHMTAYTGDDGHEGPVPDDVVERARSLRASLIESIVETDDTLMEKYFADEELTEDELRRVLHLGLDHGLIIPVVCGAAARQIGVRQCLRNIAGSGPSPAERDAIEVDGVSLEAKDDGPTVVRVFKTAADPYVGRLSYLKVVSGTLTPDMHLWNANRSTEERMGTLAVPIGKDQEPISILHAGDIGVVTKLSDTITGDTLGSKDNPLTLPPIVFPAPVYSMAVQPVSKAAVDKLGPSLQRLLEEDPGLRLERNPDTHETILQGLGDAHLDVTVERLRRKFNVDVELQLPRVPYRETIGKNATADYTHKKQTGGHGQYARVAIEVNPLPRGSGLQFNQRVVGGSVPKEFIPAVEKGVMETAREGILCGAELTDCEIVLFDGKHHPVDSNEMSFKLAAAQALREAVQSANGTLLEPVVTIKVTTPEDHAGDVVSDLNTKRARIHGILPSGNLSVVEAEVPLAEVQRYSSDLRSITQGRGSFEMTFDHYGEVPQHLAAKVIEDHRAEVQHA